MKQEKLVVILGPTATGKSKTGILLAQKLGGEIISGDSMLVYRQMDIGTAKPSPAELALVPHHLVNILPPEAAFSVVDFKERAQRLITEINGRGRLPILVGGTGLYIKALLENYTFSRVGEDAGLRRELETLADREGEAALVQKLAALDPQQAAQVNPHDRRRLIRAIETVLGGEQVSRQAAGTPVYRAAVFGLTLERSQLYERINHRVDVMLAEGLEQETRRLLEADVSPSSLSMRSIGYRQMAQYLAGELDRATMVTKIKQATRNFAKRQCTWYKKMPYIHWFDVAKVRDQEQIVEIMCQLLVEKYNLL
jgi:tRNA dimethylallyltransferase